MISRMIFCIATLGLAITGCELFPGAAETLGGQAVAPTVEMTQAALVTSPTTTEIAAFYCDDYIPDPTGLLCSPLGPTPKRSDLRFDFELVFQVDNPNNFPIPTTEILAAIDVFPGTQAASALGAVCTVLCDPADEKCDGTPGETGCQDSAEDIETIEDVKHRVTELLIMTAEAVIKQDTEELENLWVRTIPAGSDKFEIRVRFSLGIDPMLDLITVFAEQLVNKAIKGEEVVLDIDYAVHGSLWMEVPILGRVAVKYGPLAGNWVLDPLSF